MRSLGKWLAGLALLAIATAVTAAEPLASWNDGAAKQGIVTFVNAVTQQGGKDFVPEPERIAVFDNDGTLWCEQPVVQLAQIMQRWEEMAQQNPALRDQQPWKAAVAKDWTWFRTAITKHYGGDDSDMPTLSKGLIFNFQVRRVW